MGRRPVQGEPRITMNAFRHPAAIAALQGRSKAPAVDENQHLVTPFQMLANVLQQPGRKPFLQWFHGGIQQAQAWPFGIACSPGKAEMAIAAGQGVVQGLQAGCGRTQHDRDVFRTGPYYRKIAGRVAETVLLLEGAVMLFIDDDDSRPCLWRKNCRSRADENRGDAIAGLQPCLQAFTIGEPRVQDRYATAEALAEALDGLWRQAYLGYQHNGLFALLQHLVDNLHVDLGLATARDAIEQQSFETCRGSDGADRSVLLCIERLRLLGAGSHDHLLVGGPGYRTHQAGLLQRT